MSSKEFLGFYGQMLGCFAFLPFAKCTEAILSCPENRKKWTFPNWPPTKLHPPWPLPFTCEQFSSWLSSGFVFIQILNGYLLNPCYVPGKAESHIMKIQWNHLEIFSLINLFSFRNMQKMSWTSVVPHSIKIFLYPYSARMTLTGSYKYKLWILWRKQSSGTLFY